MNAQQATALKFLDDRRSEKGEHDLMMAGERKSSAASLGGAAYHIGVRPVVLDKIHVHGSEMME
jgi:predicted dinucleotide-binding enzyme